VAFSGDLVGERVNVATEIYRKFKLETKDVSIVEGRASFMLIMLQAYKPQAF
jgi:hypothetical protein